MNQKILLTLLAVSQLATAYSQDLFRMNFHATCYALQDNGRLGTKRISAQDLIARYVGTNSVGTNQEFELVYNESSNSVQVVRASTGEFISDVFQFDGGITNSDGRRQERLTFVFTPDQAEAVGSAIITEKVRHNPNRSSAHGQLQFTLFSGQTGGDTNTLGVTNVVTDTNLLGGVTGPTNTVVGTNNSGSTNLTGGSGDTNSVSTTNTVTGTNTQGLVLGTPGTALGNLTSVIPPAPGGTNTSNPTTPSITPSAPPLAITPPVPSITNSTTSGSTADTNSSSGIDLTAGGTSVLTGTNLSQVWICSGVFSVGRRVFVVGSP